MRVIDRYLHSIRDERSPSQRAREILKTAGSLGGDACEDATFLKVADRRSLVVELWHHRRQKARRASVSCVLDDRLDAGLTVLCNAANLEK